MFSALITVMLRAYSYIDGGRILVSLVIGYVVGLGKTVNAIIDILINL